MTVGLLTAKFHSLAVEQPTRLLCKFETRHNVDTWAFYQHTLENGAYHINPDFASFRIGGANISVFRTGKVIIFAEMTEPGIRDMAERVKLILKEFLNLEHMEINELTVEQVQDIY